MNEWQRMYTEAVYKARMDALTSGGEPRAAISRLYALYAKMIKDVDRDFGSGMITEARKEALSRQINARLKDLGKQLQQTFADQELIAIDKAIAGHKNGLDAINSLGFTVSANFEKVPEETIRYMLRRRGIQGSKNYELLVGRNLEYMGSEVDMFLNSAIGRGVSAERASQELAGMIARDDPRLLSLIDNGRLSTPKIKAALKEGTINEETFNEAREILWKSKRIMRTEINTAYREADVISSYKTPVVGYLKWEVSGRHFGVWSSPDICTFYYEDDQFGLGSGVFPILNLPGTPHPNCGCYSTEVYRSPKNWEKQKPGVVEPPTMTHPGIMKLLNERAKTNKHLAEGLRRVTESHIKTQINLANEYNNLAYTYGKKIEDRLK